MPTLLVIDDNYSIRETLRDVLGSKGIKVFSAEDGRKGIEIYKEKNPQYVLLDGNLPDIKGEQVFLELKKIDPGANIYFFSADTSFEKKAKQLGASGYLTKPIDLDKILKIIYAPT